MLVAEVDPERHEAEEDEESDGGEGDPEAPVEL